MIKKLVFIIFLFFTLSFLFLLMPDKAFAETCVDRNSSDWYLCTKNLGSPPDKYCREDSCSSVCGHLDKWNYCYITGCCAKGFYGGGYYDFYWQWLKRECSVGDTCRKDEEYLRPGICLDSGCAKGGDYKICCNNVTVHFASM